MRAAVALVVASMLADQAQADWIAYSTFKTSDSTCATAGSTSYGYLNPSGACTKTSSATSAKFVNCSAVASYETTDCSGAVSVSSLLSACAAGMLLTGAADKTSATCQASTSGSLATTYIYADAACSDAHWTGAYVVKVGECTNTAGAAVLKATLDSANATVSVYNTPDCSDTTPVTTGVYAVNKCTVSTLFGTPVYIKVVAGNPFGAASSAAAGLVSMVVAVVAAIAAVSF